MKKALVIIGIGLLVVCGLGGLGMRAMSQAKAAVPAATPYTAAKSNLVVTVIETGTIDATKTVELKGQVSGRLGRLLVDEGDAVRANQVVAIIDPKETQLKVRQDAATLRGAQSAIEKASVEIQQRVLTARAAYEQAKVRVAQLRLELQAQPTLTQSAIDEAQTALNTALQQREQLIKKTQPDDENTARSALNEAKANYDNALSDFNRQNQLGGLGYVAGRNVDSAKLALDLAKVRLDSANSNLSRLEDGFRTDRAKADEQIRQARAALRRAKANIIQNETKREDLVSAISDVEKARAAMMDPEIMAKGRDQTVATADQLGAILSDSQRQLGETTVRSPIDGVVTKKELQVGELASGLSAFSAGTPILRIEDRRSMRVKLDVNEIDVAKMRVGMEARIDVDAIPARSYPGIIRKIAPTSKDLAANQTQAADAVVKYEVEIGIKDPDDRLRSGMSAKCSVDVIRRENVLTLPVEYVSREGHKAYITIAPKDTKDPLAKGERREVKIGAESGSQIEIVSGLQVGEKVIRPKYNGPERKGMMQAGPEDN